VRAASRSAALAKQQNSATAKAIDAIRRAFADTLCAVRSDRAPSIPAQSRVSRNANSPLGVGSAGGRSRTSTLQVRITCL